MTDWYDDEDPGWISDNCLTVIRQLIAGVDREPLSWGQQKLLRDTIRELDDYLSAGGMLPLAWKYTPGPPPRPVHDLPPL